MASATILFVGGTPASATAVNTNFGDLNDRFLDSGTSHFHNGIDSEKVKVTLLNADTLTEGDVLQVVSGTAVAGSAQFNLTTGHYHDGADSKKIVDGAFLVDFGTVDATEYSEDALPFVTQKSFTFTPPNSDCVILGAIFDCELKQDDGTNTAEWRVTMDSINIGTGITFTWTSQTLTTTSGTYAAKYLSLMQIDVGAQAEVGPLYDNATYVFNFQTGTSDAGGTGDARIRNLKLTIYWAQKGKETTDSARIT